MAPVKGSWGRTVAPRPRWTGIWSSRKGVGPVVIRQSLSPGLRPQRSYVILSQVKPLEEKVALVTGGSRGIGRAVVERLARDGAAVIFSYQRDEEAANQVVESVAAAGGTAWAVRADQG